MLCGSQFYVSSLKDSTLPLFVDGAQLQTRPELTIFGLKLTPSLSWGTQGGTSKRDLIDLPSVSREKCIARLITNGHNLETQEAEELAANPLTRPTAPHLQALIITELVHSLKADHLQQVLEEQDTQAPKIEDSKSK
ncbi:hypothetical protein TKK_0000195 [Trichogramma kaykai]